MARIERSEVERIADLARLELSRDEVERMTSELEAILTYVDSLRALDTDDVEPTYHAIPMATPLRDDRAGAVLPPERVLANAPDRDGFAFVVPKVLDEDEA